MSGNVWEWILDEYEESYEGAPVDGSARCTSNDCTGDASTMRVVRGGAWNSSKIFLNLYLHWRSGASYKDDTQGFRIVRAIN